jgi:Yip1 domain
MASERSMSANLIDRVRAILVRPKEQWKVIDAEPADISTLYRTYVMPLAAIGPIASFVGGALIGTNTVVGSFRVPIVNALAGALVSYALALVGVYVVARVIEYFAPQYSGTRNQVQAFKVAAYSSTAQWVAGIFLLIPGLGVLSILGLYSLYLLYLGLPILMKVPAEKTTAYTITVVVVSIVISIIVAAISGIIIGTAAYSF